MTGSANSLRQSVPEETLPPSAQQHTTRGPRLRPRPPHSKPSARASCAVDARVLNSFALSLQPSQLL